MHRRLLSHFIEKNIISERQAAYLKGDSTTQQIADLQISKSPMGLTKKSGEAL